MTIIQVCRTCLAYDTLMYTIANTPLQRFYEKTTNLSFITEDGRSSVVCYICYHLIKKYHQFTESAIQADEALQRICKNGEQITKQTISMINKSVPISFHSTPVTCDDIVESDLCDVPESIDVQHDSELQRMDVFSDNYAIQIEKIEIEETQYDQCIKTGLNDKPRRSVHRIMFENEVDELISDPESDQTSTGASAHLDRELKSATEYLEKLEDDPNKGIAESLKRRQEPTKKSPESLDLFSKEATQRNGIMYSKVKITDKEQFYFTRQNPDAHNRFNSTSANTQDRINLIRWSNDLACNKIVDSDLSNNFRIQTFTNSNVLSNDFRIQSSKMPFLCIDALTKDLKIHSSEQPLISCDALSKDTRIQSENTFTSNDPSSRIYSSEMSLPRSNALSKDLSIPANEKTNICTNSLSKDPSINSSEKTLPRSEALPQHLKIPTNEITITYSNSHSKDTRVQSRKKPSKDLSITAIKKPSNAQSKRKVSSKKPFKSSEPLTIDLTRSETHHTKRHNNKISTMSGTLPRVYSRKNPRSNNLKIDDSEKKFTCSVCQKKFRRQTDLNKHLVVHTRKKNIECNYCGKKFLRYGDLKKHNTYSTTCMSQYFETRDLDFPGFNDT